MRIIGGRENTHSASELVNTPSDVTSGIEFNKFSRSVEFGSPAQRPKPFTIHTDTFTENDISDQVGYFARHHSWVSHNLLFQRHKASSYLGEDATGVVETKLNPRDVLSNSSRDVQQA